ncbi:hypothetical protein [Kineosporia sp. NBRC 101731]|uniref:hypothetical protein n=1 Tax=Kineosporia sp. NBRC 101731 TaxID=3032199 RepID=UPI0024A0A161|nr:hypothetical protein [Kineosporia sp. NBRC 101731]GLY32616.1 hypothetical protein Kisp02_59810 [Kineosporia sp. NBRC 101731]
MASSYREHPVHALLAAGVPVALATDDPRASAITLSGEYARAETDVGLDRQQIARIRETAHRARFS